MIRVLHLNASTEGGASGAAQRLHSALSSSKQVVSKHLIFSGKKVNDTHTKVMYSSAVGRFFAFAFHALDKLDFLRYERDKTIRFQFSHAKVGIDITRHKWFKEADVIHLHWVHKGFLSFRSLEKIVTSGKHIVWTLHDMWAVTGGCYYTWDCKNYMDSCGSCPYLKGDENIDLSSLLFERKKDIFSKTQSTFITPSKWMLNQAKASNIFGDVKPSMDWIPNIIETDKYSTLSQPIKNYSSNFKLHEGSFTLMFSAAYLTNPAKGFKKFVELFEQIQAQCTNVQALVLGDTKGKLYHLTNAVFMGYVSDVDTIIEAYNRSDLYVITSVQDNLPGTVLESLSCGTPVAGFNIGGIPEMIDDNENGFVVEPDKLDDLADRIINYIHSPEKHAEFAQNAREKILGTYHKDIVVEKHVNLYRALMKNPE